MNEEKNMVNCTECLHYKSCQMWATNCLNGYIRFPFREVLCDYFKPTADVVPREEAERWKNAMMGECMLSCCILRDEFMREAEISVAKKIFKDIQSCIGYINWDESGENILSFVVDFKKFNDFKEKYTKGGEQ